MRIGIFGGCFSPPHKMHKEIAENLIKNNYLDKVIFVPTGDNYTKTGLVGINQRIDMLKLMLDNEHISVSDICKDLDYQYTFEILDYYQNKYPTASLYFICGTDNLNEFENWKRYEYILSKYKLLVVMRNNDDINEIIAKYSKYKENICVANIPQNVVSSTIVRKDIKEENWQQLADKLDQKVLEYIRKKGLYKC